MNYILEINSFYDWLETNRLSKSAIALWYALMHINNKANWIESFEVAISTLEFKTGFKRSELFQARNILQQKGRIVWHSKGGNLCASYKIISFCVHNTDAIMDASTDANSNTNPTQKHTINKLNKTKQNQFKEKKKKEKIDFKKIESEFEKFRSKYPGSKRGFQTEFENFRQKHPDYEDAVFLLLAALEKLIEWRNKKGQSGQFVPEYANLQTWINQRRWEMEHENVKKEGDLNAKNQQNTTGSDDRKQQFAEHIAAKLGGGDT